MREKQWHVLALSAAALLAAFGIYFATHALLAGVIALILGTWPLLIARICLRAGGCAVYPLMIVPVWIAFPALWVFAAVSDEANHGSQQSDVLLVCYYFFVMASMILALRLRFGRAENNAIVSIGERVTISLIALAPLVLHACAYFYIAIEWLSTLIRRGA